MMVLAIESVISDTDTLDELINTLKTRYRLCVREYEVAGKRLIQVTRNSKSYYDAIHDECSNLIIDEDLTIVSRNIEKLYAIEDSFCLFDITEDDPVVVEEWLPGKQVVISRFYSTYLLSTKEDIHGRDLIVPEGPKCSDIVMHAFNHNKHLTGLDTLFSEELPEATCWCFQIVPKNEFNVSKPEDYDLVLLNAINTETNVDMTIAQLNNIGEHYNIRIPQRRHAYGMKRIKEVSEILYSQNSSILGTILTEVKHKPTSSSEVLRGKYAVNIASPWKTELNRTVGLVLKHQVHSLEIKGEPALVNMLDLLQDSYGDLLKELSSLYIEGERARTRRQFANKVKHHPMAAALFALKDRKINGLLQMYKVVKPRHLLEYIENKNTSAFKTVLDNYKETICRKVTR